MPRIRKNTQNKPKSLPQKLPLVFQKSVFARLIKEQVLQYSKFANRVEKKAIDLIQKLSENFITILFAYHKISEFL